MAVATGAAVAGLAVNAGMSAYKAHQGRKQAKEAAKQIDQYQRQDLNNAYAGVTLPMEAFRREEEALNVTTQSQIEAASMAGARGLGVAMPQIQDYQSKRMTDIGLGLQESKFRLDKLIAQDETRIQSMQERREAGDLAGLGAKYEAGRQDFYGGMGDIAQTIGAAGRVAGASGVESNQGVSNYTGTGSEMNYKGI